jgi:hypothetical protein
MVDNLTTFMCQLSWNLEASDSWNSQGLSRPVMGLLYLYRNKYTRVWWCSYWFITLKAIIQMCIVICPTIVVFFTLIGHSFTIPVTRLSTPLLHHSLAHKINRLLIHLLLNSPTYHEPRHSFTYLISHLHIYRFVVPSFHSFAHLVSSVGGLYSQNPRHFALQPPAGFVQNLRLSYLSHMIAGSI